MTSAKMTVEASFPSAPLERNARIATLVTTVVAIGGCALLFVQLGGGTLVLVTCPALLVFLLVIPLFNSVTGYAVGNRELAVLRRGGKPLIFPLGSLRSARPTRMPHSRRVTGTIGTFGYTGRFTNPDWGQFKTYATTRRQGVLLEWPGFKLYVSPEDPKALRDAVLERRSTRSKRGGSHDADENGGRRRAR